MKSIHNTNLKVILKNIFMNKEQYKVSGMKVYPKQIQFVRGLYVWNPVLSSGNMLNVPESNGVNHLLRVG